MKEVIMAEGPHCAVSDAAHTRTPGERELYLLECQTQAA